MTEKYSTDKYLVEQFQAGNTSVLAVLVKKWHKTFCQRAYWVVQDKEIAKDVAQECWIIIQKRLHRLKNAASFKSWAFRIIYTKAIDAHSGRAKERERHKMIPLGANSDEQSNKVKMKKALLEGIRQLPDDKHTIIRLFYLEEYSLREISAFLKIPVGTVKSRLFKAREKLKSLIKTMDYEK
ncbi:MAG: RNA polymerase sigma factor [Bacteroidota bacterium]